MSKQLFHWTNRYLQEKQPTKLQDLPILLELSKLKYLSQVSDLTLYNVLSAGARDGLVQPVTMAIPPPKLLKYKYRKMDIGVEETVSLKSFTIVLFMGKN